VCCVCSVCVCVSVCVCSVCVCMCVCVHVCVFACLLVIAHMREGVTSLAMTRRVTIAIYLPQ
jgi:hypothetical protein